MMQERAGYLKVDRVILPFAGSNCPIVPSAPQGKALIDFPQFVKVLAAASVPALALGWSWPWERRIMSSCLNDTPQRNATTHLPPTSEAGFTIIDRPKLAHFKVASGDLCAGQG